MKHNVSLEEVEEIKMVFDYIDTNRDGIITPRELKDVLLKCGLDGRTSTIHEMIERVDDNNSKQIEFDEFYRLMTESMVIGSNLEKFKNYFRHKMVRNTCFTNILFINSIKETCRINKFQLKAKRIAGQERLLVEEISLLGQQRGCLEEARISRTCPSSLEKEASSRIRLLTQRPASALQELTLRGSSRKGCFPRTTILYQRRRIFSKPPYLAEATASLDILISSLLHLEWETFFSKQTT